MLGVMAQEETGPAVRAVEAKRDDAALPIAFDLACIGCEYNLRTLRAEAGCPECGRPVRETLEAFSRGWSWDEIKVWRRGCKLVGISGLLTAAVPAVSLFPAFFGFGGGGMPGLGWVVGVGLMVCSILAEHAMWVWGVLRLTGGHPGAAKVSRGAITRLRVAVVVNGAIALPAVLLPLFAALIGSDDEWWMSFWGALVVAGVTARLFAVGGLMRVLSRTLGAAGRLWKRRHILVTGTVVILLCVAQGFATLALLVSQGGLGDGLFDVGAVVGIGSLFALPVVAVWAAVSVFRAGVAFKLPTA